MTYQGRGRPRKRKGRRGAFAESFRAARHALGLSQEGAARDLGVARVTVARWETGDKEPSGLARRFVEEWIARASGKGGSDAAQP
jgi:DNA-binding transcriptional regulator YiaG